MKDSTKGLIFGIITTLLFGVSPPLSKILSKVLSPLFLAFALNFIVLIFSFFYCLLRETESLRKLNLKDTLYLAVIGFLSSFLAVLFFFKGIKRISATEAAFLQQLESLFVFLIAFIFLKERLHLRQITGLVVMLLGLFALLTNFKVGIHVGSIFIIITALLFSITDVMIKPILIRVSPPVILLVRTLVGTILLTPFIAGTLQKELVLLNLKLSIILSVNSFIIFVLVFCLYSAIKYLKTAEGTSFILPAPLITASISFIFLGERLSYMQIIGGSFVLLGLYFVISKIPDSS